MCLPAEQVAAKNAAGAMLVKGTPGRRSSSNSLLGSMNTQFYKGAALPLFRPAFTGHTILAVPYPASGSTERPGRFTAVQVTAGPPRLPFLMVRAHDIGAHLLSLLLLLA